ncbi:hypothetical protein OS242_03035 [Tumebacillus sp. DT12]|uniref:NERD domain-containing protein n=1 Tax=Tumebacillus lacus TaxID=2995335 RepID=A0ABT3WWE8_9BACL|nr:hypothetical protein [Tumebacillus lacus]MCX7568936.1 hypothetical protein [Tumebacillus lacus]
MNSGMKKFIKVFTTKRDLFVDKTDTDELIDRLSTVPLGTLLNVLSRMSALPLDKDAAVRDLFERNFPIAGQRAKNKYLYSHQGLLATWKWLLAYGDTNAIEEDNMPLGHAVLILLIFCIEISDAISLEDISVESVKKHMLQNYVFNQHTAGFAALARAKMIFTELPIEVGMNFPRESINFSSKFYETYGYSIQDYLGTISLITAKYQEDEDAIFSNREVDLIKLFNNAEFTKVGAKVLDSLSISLEDAKLWAIDTIDSHWNYTKFLEYPIIKLPNGRSYPIMSKLLEEQFFSQLFFRIRNCYPRNDSKFLGFMGRVFERYVQILLERAIHDSSLPYEVIQEFEYEYGAGGVKRSPDLMLRLGDKLLVIETKSRRLLLETILEGEESYIEKDIDRMVIEPIKQIHDRLSELIHGVQHSKLKGIRDIFVMSVTTGEFPTIQFIEDKITERLSSLLDMDFKGHFHLSIEEFELMSNLIGRKNGKPIFRILENKKKLFPGMSFTNFIVSTSLPNRFPKLIFEKLSESLDDFSRHFGSFTD